MFLWEETGKCTVGTHQGRGPGIRGKTRRDNVGKGHFPAGTRNNLQRLWLRAIGVVLERNVVWRMSPYEL